MIFLALNEAVIQLIDLLHRDCEINASFTCLCTQFFFFPPLNSLEMVTICRSDSPGRGRVSRNLLSRLWSSPLAERCGQRFLRELHRKMFEMQIRGGGVCVCAETVASCRSVMATFSAGVWLAERLPLLTFSPFKPGLNSKHPCVYTFLDSSAT